MVTTGGQFAVTGGLTNSPDGDDSTLAAWRTATGKDPHSISATPGFFSAQDLHIGSSGSPVSHTGITIAGVTVDIDGDTGSRASTPDIGCDEILTHTLAVTAVGPATNAQHPDVPDYTTRTPVTHYAKRS